MKELTIEQKAQRYDEAIETTRKWYDANTNEGYRGIFEEIFPELKESEDERIRKEIIDFIYDKTDTYELREKSNSWLAWLEKQVTPQVRTGLEWVNTIDDACDKRYSEEYAHGEYCHEQSFKWGFQEGVDWLEKQGEQQDVSIQINPSEYINDMGGNGCYLKNTTQKPAEEIEPTPIFRIGDILKRKGKDYTFRVDRIQYGYYYSDRNRGAFFPIEEQGNWELVEQKPVDKVSLDFKKGDILYEQKTMSILLVYERNGSWLMTFCDYWMLKGKLHVEFPYENYGLVQEMSLVPATKEQRDLLFQKMHDAGYEWDAEKKELKKDKQMPAEIEKLAKGNERENPISVWSEEDERYINIAVSAFSSPSLERLYHYNKVKSNDLINWLKSLKERYTWKPSEEQMECLYDAIKHYQTNGYPASKLNELYEQMSKIYKL